MSHTRRRFLQTAAAAAAAAALPRPLGAVAGVPRREPLRVAAIGVGGRGWDNLMGVAGEDVVALCDVDERHLARAVERFPAAKRFHDFRQLLTMDGLDAVVVSTPDHTHFLPSALALRRGLHVYCEKPLCHTVAQVRALRELAAQKKCVTQMGTQIHSLPNYRRVVEHVQAGVLGPVREVHVFVNGTNWSGRSLPAPKGEAPAHLHWDLWLGPAPARPYADGYHPAHWRRYWDFGGGTTADMACHFTDLAFWALDLAAPTRVAAEGPAPDPHCAPTGIVVRYAFPARGDRPAVDLTWYDGDRRPPVLAERGLEAWVNGVLFVGERGWLIADYTRMELGPKQAFADFTPPEQTIAASPGHYQEWLQAIRGEGRPLCHFDYAGPLTVAVLLGVAAHRAGNVATAWDAAAMRADHDGVQALLSSTPRDGWGG